MPHPIRFRSAEIEHGSVDTHVKQHIEQLLCISEAQHSIRNFAQKLEKELDERVVLFSLLLAAVGVRRSEQQVIGGIRSDAEL